MADAKGVLVFGEVADGTVAAATQELLGVGCRLASALGEPLSVALLGPGLTAAAKEAIAFGADKVYVVDDPLLQAYQPDPYVAAMEKVCAQASPRILLLSQNDVGRDLAPRLAFRLGTGLSTDCIDLCIDESSKLLLETRPVYGGNALAQFVCEGCSPQIATARAKAFEALARDDSRQGEVISIAAGLDASVVRAATVQKVKEETEGVRLEDAVVVVSGGRGMGGAENFQMLEALAKLFGGAVGATRAACDSGWVPATIQIGLTGKIVSPTVYFAVALSGASQHMAGCSGAKNIIAINKDPEANIFRAAHYGVVGDYKQVLPALVEKCKELLAG